jgi:heme-degrading monooxygenase HmoA
MIIVHDTFVCKPGNAGKVAKMFKEAMVANPYFSNVMTDMTGQYHRVIMVSHYDSLSAFEKSFEEMQNPTPEMKEAFKKMEGYQDMYTTGSREIYKVW